RPPHSTPLILRTLAQSASLLFLRILLCFLFFFLMLPRPPISTLFPYTTLFRSLRFMLVHPFHQYSTLSFLSNSCRINTVINEITRIITPIVAPYPKLYCWKAC